jgi:SAM-dependent methyltransferase
VETSFRKDMSHLTWDEVYARQAKRAHLLGDWLDALGLKPGDHVLEVGAGPGYMSLILAERVGKDGVVYAVDRSAEALSYLERLQGERGIRHIRRIVADAATLEAADLHPNSALITMRTSAGASLGAGADQSLVQGSGIFGARLPTPDPGALHAASATRVLTRGRVAGGP